MKLKQLEGLLGSLDQFENPKVFLSMDMCLWMGFVVISYYFYSLFFIVTKANDSDAATDWIGTISNWAPYCISVAVHCSFLYSIRLFMFYFSEIPFSLIFYVIIKCDFLMRNEMNFVILFEVLIMCILSIHLGWEFVRGCWK